MYLVCQGVPCPQLPTKLCEHRPGPLPSALAVHTEGSPPDSLGHSSRESILPYGAGSRFSIRVHSKAPLHPELSSLRALPPLLQRCAHPLLSTSPTDSSPSPRFPALVSLLPSGHIHPSEPLPRCSDQGRTATCLAPSPVVRANEHMKDPRSQTLGVEVDSRGRGGMQLDSEGIEIARGNSVERSIHSKVCGAPGQPSHCMAATASAGFGRIARVSADSSLFSHLHCPPGSGLGPGNMNRPQRQSPFLAKT